MTLCETLSLSLSISQSLAISLSLSLPFFFHIVCFLSVSLSLSLFLSHIGQSKHGMQTQPVHNVSVCGKGMQTRPDSEWFQIHSGATTLFSKR